jgi:hypothetical protein
MMMIRSSVLVPMTCSCGVFLLLSGCVDSGSSKSEAPPVATATSDTASDTPAEPASTEPSDGNSPQQTGETETRAYAGLSFEVPTAWEELEKSQFYDSKFIVHSEHGDMELTLASVGGGIDANLNRWVGQVGQAPGDEPTWSTLDVAGIESRMVDVRGSFNSRLPGQTGSQENWRLIGVAVPLPRDFYVKLVGPREAVAEFQDDLTAFLKTAKQP